MSFPVIPKAKPRKIDQAMGTDVDQQQRIDALKRRRTQQQTGAQPGPAVQKPELQAGGLSVVQGSPAQKPPDTQFDIQRERAKVEAGQLSEQQQEALQQRLAGAGFGRGSGFLEAQETQLAGELSGALQRRLGGIGEQEAALLEERREAGLGREFEAGQTEKGFAFEAGQSALDRELTRETTAQEFSFREKQLVQDGQQFTDELAFRKFAAEGGWSQQEADRVWNTLESAKDREQQTKLQDDAQDFELTKINLTNITKKNFAQFQQELDEEVEIRKGKNDSWFARGQANPALVLSPQDMAAMGPGDFDAFLAGQSGTRLEDYTANRDAKIAAKNAAITALDPDDPFFRDDLAALTGTLLDSTQRPPLEDGAQTPSNQPPGEFNLGSTFTRKGTNRYTFTNVVPGDGSDVVIGGKSYRVAGGVGMSAPWFGDNTNYFLAIDPVTRGTVAIVPSGFPDGNKLLVGDNQWHGTIVKG